jgi:hypothetical protein
VKTGAVHPFCASGECAQGREVAEMFPELVAQRPSEPKRPPPRLDLVQAAQEESMACSECGSKTCHKATCSKRPGAKPQLPPPPKATPRGEGRRVVRAAAGGPDLASMTAMQLRDLRAKVDEALRAKVATLEAEARAAKTEADAIREALGEAA